MSMKAVSYTHLHDQHTFYTTQIRQTSSSVWITVLLVFSQYCSRDANMNCFIYLWRRVKKLIAGLNTTCNWFTVSGLDFRLVLRHSIRLQTTVDQHSTHMLKSTVIWMDRTSVYSNYISLLMPIDTAVQKRKYALPYAATEKLMSLRYACLLYTSRCV